LILVVALFLLDGGRRREGKKRKKEKKEREITVGEEGFPGTEPASLAVPLQLLGAIKADLRVSL
jgi:hypothetical protein